MMSKYELSVGTTILKPDTDQIILKSEFTKYKLFVTGLGYLL